MKFFLSFLLLVLCFHSVAQKKKELFIPEVFDSTQFLFEFDMKYLGESTDVDPNYQYVLEWLVELLEKNPTWTVLVRGHVCCGPSEKISKKRACKAYKVLLKMGIAKEKINFKGFSDTKPLIFPEKTEEDAHANRRVDFIITK